MTNQDTCVEGLNNVGGAVKDEMGQRLKDLSELVSNCLAIYAATSGLDDFSGTPIQNRRRRRLLGSGPEPNPELKYDPEFPGWMSRAERQLLGTPTQSIQADIIVAQDGSGTVRTISEAIKQAPEYSPRRVLIRVKAGMYVRSNPILN
uniref:Pectinesterase n=1 Tax=Opuntia streptacantha TaxID=393608 RepID=A0A7C8ZJZ7_OPUST